MKYLLSLFVSWVLNANFNHLDYSGGEILINDVHRTDQDLCR